MKYLLALLFASSVLAADPDLSSPKAAAKSLYQAMQAQDESAILKIFYAPDEQDRELAKAYGNLIVAGKKLADAAKEKFGASGEAIGAGAVGAEELSRVDSADVKINGDTATIQFAGMARPVTLHRTGNDWQVVLSDFAGTGPGGISRQITFLKKVGETLSDTATEINADKFPTAQAAESVLQGKLSRIMIKAATQATTKPAK